MEMTPGLFVGILSLSYLILLRWACRSLPEERWQVFAAVPMSNNGNGEWHGLNITFYGIIVASSYMIGAAAALVMLGAVGVSPFDVFLLVAPLLSVCVPASRWVAGIVENKPQTITVAGASFVGLLLTPWLTLAVRNALGGPAENPGLDAANVMAAITVGYAFGEGLGRLACISFGCCYGKPLENCPAWVRRIMGSRGFIFSGATKKISYESGLDGKPVVPIQAVTSAVCVGAGMLGLYLFLAGRPMTAFMATLAVTQLWRAVSEMFRADYRGVGRLSAYQYMALAAIGYGIVIAALFPSETGAAPRLDLGLTSLWNPWVLMALEVLWLAILLNVGRSKVTGSTIRFHVVRSEI